MDREISADIKKSRRRRVMLRIVAGIAAAGVIVGLIAAFSTPTVKFTEAIASFDEVLLEQALVNIVKNAAESIRDTARTNGNIHLTLIENAGSPGSGPTLTIADNGSGISPEAHGRLFSSFYTSKTGGQGLGLMFVAEILSNHGCRFPLEPLPDAPGATFRISFPRQ